MVFAVKSQERQTLLFFLYGRLTTVSAHSNKCNCSCLCELGVKVIGVQQHHLFAK